MRPGAVVFFGVEDELGDGVDGDARGVGPLGGVVVELDGGRVLDEQVRPVRRARFQRAVPLGRRALRHVATSPLLPSSADAVGRLSPETETALYRIVQEALTNVARHAQASRAEVKIQKLDGAVCIKIKDNGKGFPAEPAKRNKRLGLLGMRERVEMVGGNLTIKSTRGQGTTIQAQIPLAESARAGGAGG